METVQLDRRQFLAAGVAMAATTSGCAGNDFNVVADDRFPQGPFGADSTAEEVTAGIDLTGKVALVTGCNSGLGFETMRVLAMRGARVLGTGRTLAKAEVACESVDGDTTPLELELGSFDSVVACADSVVAGDDVDIVVCNAGINTFGELELVNGVERMFAINHLGHFLLVNRLLPSLLAQPGGSRLVHVGSRSGYGQAPSWGIDFDNLRGEKNFDSGQAYGRSKLANALFSNELARRLRGSPVTSNVIHPGLVKTNIARTAPAFIRTAFDALGGLIAKSPAQGAATQVYAATAPALDGVSGAYLEDCNPVIVEGPHHMYDKEMATRLWEVSEQLVSTHLA